MIAYSDLTDHPNIYKDAYWGTHSRDPVDHIITPDVDIIGNRNRFVTDYNIVKGIARVPEWVKNNLKVCNVRELREKILWVPEDNQVWSKKEKRMITLTVQDVSIKRKKLEESAYFGRMLLRMSDIADRRLNLRDHREYYKDKEGNYVCIFSPYDHGGTRADIPAAEQCGYKKIYRIYNPYAITYVKILPPTKKKHEEMKKSKAAREAHTAGSVALNRLNTCSDTNGVIISYIPGLSIL